MSTPLHPSPHRILVRGVNWLGDAVMTTPALLRLGETFPDAAITLLCPEKLAELWKHHPAISEVITFAPEENVFAVGRKLRSVKFDLALVLPNSPRSALETYLGKIPQRIGYARPWRNFFLTKIVESRAGAVKMQKRSAAEIKQLMIAGQDRQLPPAKAAPKLPASAHQMHEYLHLAAALGANPEPLAPQLFVTDEEVEAAKIKFGLDKTPRAIYGLNPGAEYGPAKRWPLGRFIATAQHVQSQNNCLWLLFGGKNDEAAAAQIHSALGNRQSAINVAGKTSLRELMALLKLCRVLLTNDTGPMHVAAALGTPVVVPFGSTSPELTGPGLPGDPRHQLLKASVPCSPCFLRECPIDFRCMNGIGIERVVEAVIRAGH